MLTKFYLILTITGNTSYYYLKSEDLQSWEIMCIWHENTFLKLILLKKMLFKV